MMKKSSKIMLKSKTLSQMFKFEIESVSRNQDSNALLFVIMKNHL